MARMLTTMLCHDFLRLLYSHCCHEPLAGGGSQQLLTLDEGHTHDGARATDSDANATGGKGRVATDGIQFYVFAN